jgi:hypothetical protein
MSPSSGGQIMKSVSQDVVLGVEKLHQALSSRVDCDGVLASLFADGWPAACPDRRWRKVGSQEVHDCPVIAVEVEGLASELHIQITRSPNQTGSGRITFLDLRARTTDGEAWLAGMAEALRLAFGPSEMLGTAERYRKTTDQVQKTLLEPNAERARLLVVRRGAVRGR